MNYFVWWKKRAPGRKKGGKAHGPKPRILRYPLNKKIRLQGRIKN